MDRLTSCLGLSGEVSLPQASKGQLNWVGSVDKADFIDGIYCNTIIIIIVVLFTLLFCTLLT